jgi:HK97 family phage prohead protease
MNKEIRSIPNGSFEVRTAANGQKNVRGYLAVYNTRSVDLGGFVEKVMPGAFKSALQPGADIRLLTNHDWSKPLARTAAGTLQLRDDDYGLGFSAELPNTTYANDLAESMQRGDVTGCSFGFNCDPDGDSWDNEGGDVVRSLRSVTMMEGSIVSSPAYLQATVSLRTAPEAIRASLESIRTTYAKIDYDAFDHEAALMYLVLAKRKQF